MRQRQHNHFLQVFVPGLLVAGLLSASAIGFAQATPSPVPDAQIEANVLKVLAGSPELADQAIKSTTVYGTVTLSGTVRDESSRNLAEKLVSNAPNVKKVIDELTVSTAVTKSDDVQPANDSEQRQSAAEEETNPNLQSDGTIAPQTTSNQAPSNPPVVPQAASPISPNPPQSGAYPPAAGSPNDQQPYAQPYPQRPYGAPAYPQRPYVEQKGSEEVVVPNGTMIRVRINQAFDSKHTVPGTAFDGVVLNDVIAGGSVAIPRGASIQGKVIDVHKAGDFKGKGTLTLQLTDLTLGGRTYPLASNTWIQHGADKTGQTVNNTIGLGAMGALIGAVAGGGAGAAVGAGVGSVAGLGVSSLSGRGEAVLPSEAILVFHLMQPTTLTTVSQAELNRLSSNVPLPGVAPQMQRRYYPPPPPPPYYYRPY